jgi:hypothetical protein
LSLVFSGCVKELKVDFGEPSRKIVLYPFLTENKQITIKMSAPASILSNEFPQLVNPVVVITDNEVPVDTVIINSMGKGVSDIIPARQHVYGFSAFADGYLNASCTVKLPEPVQGIEIDTSHFFFYSNNSRFPFLNVRMKIKDDPNALNYYKVSIFSKKYMTMKVTRGNWPNRVTYDSAYTQINNEYIIAKNPLLDFFSTSNRFYMAQEELSIGNEPPSRYQIGSEVYYNAWELYFSDNLFNGKEVILPMILSEFYISTSYPGKYMIELSSISQEYYLGLKSYARYGSKEHYDIPVSEEVSIFSAVKDGYGFPIAYVTVCDSSYWFKR